MTISFDPTTDPGGLERATRELIDSVARRKARLIARDDAAESLEIVGRAAGSWRCRLRIFRISEGKEAGKWGAFFYKPSVVPHSSDRYSYGAAVFAGSPGADRAERWLDYLESGLDPERIPADVKRAFTFALPEFDSPLCRIEGEAASEEPVFGPGTPERAAGTPFGASVSASRTDSPAASDSPLHPMNAGELEVDLFCRGLSIDPSCSLETDARLLSRTRAGLGSGLEMVIPGALKDLWVNVPVEEDFAQDSPYRLTRFGPGDYRVVDERLAARPAGGSNAGYDYPVRLPPEPAWYRKKTRKGTLMSRVGVLQGTYLGIYISNSCGFWYHKPDGGCRFCTTGLNVGVNEVAHKDVDDVVDVARAARRESGNTFVHFNSGFQGGDQNLEAVTPYVKAVKEEVGALIGVQVVPSPNLEKYDRLIELGANHFSFCYEFHNPEYFARYLPGKARLVGQETFFRALEYCTKKLGKGSCSGEIIAGVEPIEDTLKAIDYITGVGAFPTVCIFRPTIGSAMERHPSPRTDDMLMVMRYMYEACRRNGIPIGMAPNIEVSLIVNPDDARYLVERNWNVRLYESKLALMRLLARPYFAWEQRPRGRRASEG